MVSVEKKSEYLLDILENQKLSAFNNLLSEKSLVLPSSKLNESDEVYFGVLSAIHSNDKNVFETYYNKKNKSKPGKDSPTPFVNDDFLIFCLIIGIIKFGIDKDWIRYIISIRNRTPITITFENILNEDYHSKPNLPEVILVFLKLINLALIDNDLLNTTYKSIVQNISLFKSKSDFHILCAINAENLIIEWKIVPTGSEVSLLKRFNEKFLKRIKIFRWIVQTLVFILFLFVLVKILSFVPNVKDFFDKYNPVFTSLGVLGISVLGNLFPTINKKTFEFLLRIFGYPVELIKKETTKHES
jgi:hypothetical protein